MFFRALFTTLLLGATILMTWQEKPSMLEPSLLFLYGIIAGTYLLTFVYGFLHKRMAVVPFAYVQIILDTLQISLIIFVTGGYYSVFTFLYLVVVTYSSIFVQRKGTLVIAALCGIQYGVMLDLEFYRILRPFYQTASEGLNKDDGNLVLFKIVMTTLGCFVVAMLASMLSDQERNTRKELRAMRAHLNRMEKMATLGELSARLAHEIKNPLAALVGSVRMLGEDPGIDPANTRLMRIILREADRLNNLVTEFLVFSRPVASNPVKVDVRREVGEILDIFGKHEAARGKARVEQHLAPDLWISMEPAHLKQVLWNLLLNAVEAIPGQGWVEVSTGAMGDGQAFLRIRDNGAGISEEVMHRLFDPFFTTKQGGSGLGLSIVFRILESYNYRLDVESAPGKGSTFTIIARRVSAPKEGV
jgi:two-component system sensor histidine kinase PilS (NtrC family)